LLRGRIDGIGLFISVSIMERPVTRRTGETGEICHTIRLTVDGLSGLDLDFTNVINA
jgi:hypothetical protein